MRAHRSTLVFVNSRRAAERLALRLNELRRGRGRRRARSPRPPRLARARGAARDRGPAQGAASCPAWSPPRRSSSASTWAPSTSCPGRVAQVGRARPAAHRPRRPRRRRRLARAASSPSSAPTCSSAPSSRAACARARSRRRVVPRNPLDVLAQQIVAIAAAPARRASRSTTCTRSSRAHLLRASSTARQLENVLDMLDGRYPSDEFGELRRADRVGPHSPARSAPAGAPARSRSPTRGTIPDRGLFGVILPDGRRVGELDEEMVYEARQGQTFLLGATVVADRGDHPRPRASSRRRPACPAPCRSGTAIGRPPARAGRGDRRASRAGRSTQDAGRAAARLRPRRARRPQPARLPARAAGGDRRRARPTARSSSSASATRSATGALCVLSPFGGRVHAAWALALSARIRERVRPRGRRDLVRRRHHRAPARRRRAAAAPSWCCVEPDEVEDLVRRPSSAAAALFGARFRENAARALLIPRRLPRPAHAALAAAPQGAVAARGRAPLRRSSRSCSRPTASACATCSTCRGSIELLRGCDARALRWSRSRRPPPRRSPRRCSSTTSRPTCTRATRRTPSAAPRRSRSTASCCASCSARTSCASCIDAGALEQVEDDLQRRSAHAGARRRRAARPAAPARRPDARTRRASASPSRPTQRRGSPSSTRERRAAAVRIAGEQRWIAAEDAGPLPRRARRGAAVAACPRLPRADVPDALERLVLRYARTHGPFETAELRARYGVDPGAALRGARARAASSCAASCGPAARRREWCDPRCCGGCGGASLAALRREIEPAERSAPGALRCRPGRASTAHAAAGAGVDRLREVLVPLQGLRAARELWERDVLPRRASAPTRRPGSTSSAPRGEVVWVGAGVGRRTGGRALLPRRRGRCSARPPRRPSRR